MITGKYYLVANDGFGRTVFLDSAHDASSLDDAYEDNKARKKWSAVYIIHVVRGTEAPV